MTDIILTPALERQYNRLQDIRGEWCSSKRRVEQDRTSETVVLDGSRLDNVPGFFLALGEAVNGSDGYFGACLDSLSDCLCGGFGLALPLKIEILNSRVARENLGPEAVAAWDMLQSRRISTTIDSDNKEDTSHASLTKAPVHNYFDEVIEVFQNAGAEVKLIA